MNRGPDLLRILVAALCGLAYTACSGEPRIEPDAPDVLSGDDDVLSGDDDVLSGDTVGQSGAEVPPRVRIDPDGGVSRSPADSGVAQPSEPTVPPRAPAPSESSDAGAAVEPAAPSQPELGELPAELSALAWPAPPRTTREVTVASASELAAAAAVAGTRIFVRGAVGGDVSIGADDVEIVADSATSLGVLSIPHRRARVRVEGGRWAGVRVAVPATFIGGASYSPELMAEDLSFDGLTIDAGGETALEIRGKRIAVLRSDVTAGRYSVWCGDTAHFQTEDLILFDNVFRSAGPEATVRLVDVLRSAAVSNVLSNTYKHNYRIHGVSDLNFAADNLLVGTGVMLGRMEGDRLGRVWFDDNVMHHDAPDLFNPDAAIASLWVRRNVVYADERAELYGGVVQAGWNFAENRVAPYAPPPAF